MIWEARAAATRAEIERIKNTSDSTGKRARNLRNAQDHLWAEEQYAKEESELRARIAELEAENGRLRRARPHRWTKWGTL